MTDLGDSGPVLVSQMLAHVLFTAQADYGTLYDFIRTKIRDHDAFRVRWIDLEKKYRIMAIPDYYRDGDGNYLQLADILGTVMMFGNPAILKHELVPGDYVLLSFKGYGKRLRGYISLNDDTRQRR